MTRRARTNDRWRAIPHISHAVIPRTVTLSDPAIAFPPSIELRQPITIYAGLNGVGKTRLLRQIAIQLDEAARLIVLHDLSAWLLRLMAERTDLVDATEEVEQLDVDRDTLDAVKNVVGRNYSAVAWYALDFEDSPFRAITHDDTIPFFVVEDGGATYTMLDMGLGELAAHVLLWAIWYLRDESDVVILLDEPDAYFPPRSREPLLDHIANTAVVRHQAFVLTTHSREVLERAISRPVDIGYVARVRGHITITSDMSQVRRIVQEVLYPEERIELVAWVEDESAYALTVALLTRIDPAMAHRWVLYWANGKGDLEVLQRAIPRPARTGSPLDFAFFIDGNEQPPESGGEVWPMILLPGGASPDELFQRYAPSARSVLAEGFGIDDAVLVALLGQVEGADAHDWTNDLAAGSRIDRSSALRVIASAALASEGGEELVEAFKVGLMESGLRLFASPEGR